MMLVLLCWIEFGGVRMMFFFFVVWSMLLRCLLDLRKNIVLVMSLC